MPGPAKGTTSVRDARAAERDALIRLCLRATASRGYQADFLARCRASLARTLTTARRHGWSVRVAERDGVPLGVAASRTEGADAELELLFVEPAVAGQGIGSALLADQCRLCAARGARSLRVLAEPAAEGFYRRRGAVRLGSWPLEAFPELPPRPRLRLALSRAAPTLATERLVLRAWRTSDLAPFAALNADPRVARLLSGPLDRAASDALAARLSGSFARHGLGNWAVERSDLPGRPFIGAIGLLVPAFEAPFTPCVEIGWRLADAHQLQGLATEGARAALAHAFDVIGLDEVVAFTVPRNAASRRVMEKIGMRRDADGDFDHPKFPPGHPLRRHLLYRIGASPR